jgi:hypothetical protein
MNGTEIFLLVLSVIAIIMLYAMIWWPVATVGAAMIVVCAWGVVFGDWGSKVCEYMPEDPACAEYIDQ